MKIKFLFDKERLFRIEREFCVIFFKFFNKMFR